MLESIKLIYHQAIEAMAEGGVKDIFRPRVFWNRIATPVVMELSTSKIPTAGQFQNPALQFVEIKMKDMQTGNLPFIIPSRGLKAWRNLKKGFRCFAITEDSQVVGDVWCLTPKKDGSCISHHDLEMLGISCEKEAAYAFDMLIAPAYRGKNLAGPLQRFLQARLSLEGCKKVYGFYWNDNLPALWMHRMLKFKELPKRRVTRFFFLEWSKGAGMAKPTVQKA